MSGRDSARSAGVRRRNRAVTEEKNTRSAGFSCCQNAVCLRGTALEESIHVFGKRSLLKETALEAQMHIDGTGPSLWQELLIPASLQVLSSLKKITPPQYDGKCLSLT